MGYLSIINTYKEPTVFQFRRLYALEKIHGTSAHVKWTAVKNINEKPTVSYFSGGASHHTFISLFNEVELIEKLQKSGLPLEKDIVIYGEAYGGSQQGMSHMYGPSLKFIVFDIQIGDTTWLNVPNCEDVAKKLGLEFVFYEEIEGTVAAADAAKLRPSTQSVRNGISEPKITEGVVLRPLQEFIRSNGDRVIAKHKNKEFSETATERVVTEDPQKLAVLNEVNAIANEWVTPMRLDHVLQKIDGPHTGQHTLTVINAMLLDVLKEGHDEFIHSKEAEGAIKKRTAVLYKEYLAKLTEKTG